MTETSSNPTNEAATNEATPNEAASAAASKFESGKTHVKRAAAELRSVAEEKAHEFRGRAETAYEQARIRARSLQKEGEHYVRENPMRGVLTALGVGFVIGLLFRR